MSAEMLNSTLIGPASRYTNEKQEAAFTVAMDELAGLRFSILLTSAWESSDAITKRRRGELRTELTRLRPRYLNKLDEIAMNFGVQAAMAAKEEVEYMVELPTDMEPPADPEENGSVSL